MGRVLLFILCTGMGQGLLGQSFPSKWNHLLESPSIHSNYFLIHSKNILKEDVLVRKLDNEFAIVRTKNEFLHANEEVYPLNNSWKLNINPRNQRQALYYVQIIEPIDWKEFPDVSLISSYQNIHQIKSSHETIIALAEHPSITYLSNESAYPKVESRVIDLNLNPNRVNKIHRFFPSVNGSSQTISIQENRYDVSDIDLINRNVSTLLSSEIVDNHATEMATIIAGAGSSFITGRGVAQKARITSSDFVDVLPDQDSEYTQLSINIQNHSYGTEIESFYGAQAAAFDQSAFNNTNLLHVFSSGNQGTGSSPDGVYKDLSGYANLTGNYKMAKNSLVVGSVDTVGNEIAFVSRGPAYDGRIKPEIVAYSVVGSSNSAALVSGVSVLLQEQYESIYGQDMPSALAKAILVNGAEDVGVTGIDHITGYGNVDAFKSLEILQNNWLREGSIDEGQTQQFALSIPPNAVNLKITICWTDVPSEIGNPKALVNDLDLKLISSSTEEWLPWTLSTAPSSIDLGLPATRSIDRVNNVEQVTLPYPDGTDYVIEVHGFEVIDSQRFHIAYQYDIEEELEWDFPTASDNMPYNGETGSYFRWKSTLSETFGSLEYSIDGGANWLLLSDHLDITKGYWRWPNPPDIHVEAIARISAGSRTFSTESFTISRPPKVSVGFVCGDSLRLQWKSIGGATAYTIYSPGVENLELFQTTTDTAIIITDINQLEDNRFSITPILGNGKEAILSQTLDFTQQATSCFLLSFFQEVNLDSGIFLHARLGTIYGVEKVSFQREVDNLFTDIRMVEFPTTSDIRVLDQDPIQGNNTHRIVIDFINGQSISEEVTGSFYLTQLATLVYPNPVMQSSELNVITKELTSPNPRFRIFNSQGIEVGNVPIFGSQVTISTLGLRAGVYLFWVVDGPERYAGRFIVR
ncbi:MAG: S8 family serine peptidase [Cyclobacteriaceae bacterium]